MKRLVVFFSFACLLTLCLTGTAYAVSSPTVSTIIPASAPNDLDTPVVITGTGFAEDAPLPRRSPGNHPTDRRDLRHRHDPDRHGAVRDDPRPLRPHGHQPGHRQRHSDRRLHRHLASYGERHRPRHRLQRHRQRPVTITGAGFVATPTVTLGSTALTNVTFVHDTTVTATIPGA